MHVIFVFWNDAFINCVKVLNSTKECSILPFPQYFNRYLLQDCKWFGDLYQKWFVLTSYTYNPAIQNNAQNKQNTMSSMYRRVNKNINQKCRGTHKLQGINILQRHIYLGHPHLPPAPSSPPLPPPVHPLVDLYSNNKQTSSTATDIMISLSWTNSKHMWMAVYVTTPFKCSLLVKVPCQLSLILFLPSHFSHHFPFLLHNLLSVIFHPSQTRVIKE